MLSLYGADVSRVFCCTEVLPAQPLSVCQPVCLSACLSVCLSACLPVSCLCFKSITFRKHGITPKLRAVHAVPPLDPFKRP